MTTKFANNASSTLAGAITSGATTINLATGDGAKFPVLSGGDTHLATLTKLVGGVPTREIVLVTARTGDALTVVRAQESTTAQAFSGGDQIELRITAGTADNWQQKTDHSISYSEIRAANYIDKTTTNAAATGTVTLNCDLADIFALALSGNATLALSNVPTLSGETFVIIVRVSQGATAFALTWFSGITWLTAGGVAPSAPGQNKTIEYVLSTTNGTAWLGRKGAAN